MKKPSVAEKLSIACDYAKRLSPTAARFKCDKNQVKVYFKSGPCLLGFVIGESNIPFDFTVNAKDLFATLQKNLDIEFMDSGLRLSSAKFSANLSVLNKEGSDDLVSGVELLDQKRKGIVLPLMSLLAQAWPRTATIRESEGWSLLKDDKGVYSVITDRMIASMYEFEKADFKSEEGNLAYLSDITVETLMKLKFQGGVTVSNAAISKPFSEDGIAFSISIVSNSNHVDPKAICNLFSLQGTEIDTTKELLQSCLSAADSNPNYIEFELASGKLQAKVNTSSLAYKVNLGSTKINESKKFTVSFKAMKSVISCLKEKTTKLVLIGNGHRVDKLIVDDYPASHVVICGA